MKFTKFLAELRCSGKAVMIPLLFFLIWSTLVIVTLVIGLVQHPKTWWGFSLNILLLSGTIHLFIIEMKCTEEMFSKSNESIGMLFAISEFLKDTIHERMPFGFGWLYRTNDLNSRMKICRTNLHHLLSDNKFIIKHYYVILLLINTSVLFVLGYGISMAERFNELQIEIWGHVFVVCIFNAFLITSMLSVFSNFSIQKYQKVMNEPSVILFLDKQTFIDSKDAV